MAWLLFSWLSLSLFGNRVTGEAPLLAAIRSGIRLEDSGPDERDCVSEEVVDPPTSLFLLLLLLLLFLLLLLLLSALVSAATVTISEGGFFFSAAFFWGVGGRMVSKTSIELSSSETSSPGDTFVPEAGSRSSAASLLASHPQGGDEGASKLTRRESLSSALAAVGVVVVVDSLRFRLGDRGGDGSSSRGRWRWGVVYQNVAVAGERNRSVASKWRASRRMAKTWADPPELSRDLALAVLFHRA